MSHYDGFAREYDEAVARHSPVIECAYEYILDQLKEVSGHQVCDVGCGQGELARRLARAGARVTGVDLSGELLNLARTRSSTQTIEWVHDDAQSLRALPDNRFDIAVANLMLMDTPEFQKVLVFEAVHLLIVRKPRTSGRGGSAFPCFIGSLCLIIKA